MSILKKLLPRSNKNQPPPPAPKRGNPSQRSLDILIEKVTRARVLAGGMSRGKALGTEVLVDENDPQAVIALRECLAIVDDVSTFGYCTCLGDNALELYAGDLLIATLGLHHGRSIRWGAWKYDALLVDGERLLAWMAERGATAPLEAYREARLLEEVQRRALARWQEAMPRCLYPYAEEMFTSARGMASFIPLIPEGPPGKIEEVTYKLIPLLSALAAEFMDVDRRILTLFQWYGSGQGPWSGFPSYENIAEGLLLAFPLDQLLAALTQNELTPTHLEGAARFFAGYYFAKYHPSDIHRIPPDFRQRLLEHSLVSNDQDRLQRAVNAFSAPPQT